MKRRDFVKQAIKVGVAVNALPLLVSGSPVRALGRSVLRSALEDNGTSGRILVIIQLAGGNDGLNTLVPHTNSIYNGLRPTLGLKRSENNLIVLKDHDTLAFHSGLSKVSSLYEAGHLAIVQNVGYPHPDLSHFRGTDIWNTATDSDLFGSTGWIGRLLGDLNPNYPPAVIPPESHPLAIQFGGAPSNVFWGKHGGMGVAINALPTAGEDSAHDFDTIDAAHEVQYAALDYVRTIQKETEVYTETLLKRSVTSNKVTYPDSEENTLAAQLANVAQLIASGFTTQIYLVSQTGYDTHSNQLTEQAKLLEELSEAIGFFQQDLEAFGVADRVVTMTYSEFGRRPKENGSGTDHGTAAPMFILGSKVQGGVLGHDPDLQNLVNGNLAYDPKHDFRNVYATLMRDWLGIAQAEVAQILTASGDETYSRTTAWPSLEIIKRS